MSVVEMVEGHNGEQRMVPLIIPVDEPCGKWLREGQQTYWKVVPVHLTWRGAQLSCLSP